MGLPAATGKRACFGWFVIQPRPKPALGFLQRHALSEMIIKQLVTAEFANGEIL
jgi:hypothetical protein